MAFFHQLCLLALAAFVSMAAAGTKDDFPLPWLCLGLTVIGVIICAIVVYRRPKVLMLPGHVVMTAKESGHVEDSSATNERN